MYTSITLAIVVAILSIVGTVLVVFKIIRRHKAGRLGCASSKVMSALMLFCIFTITVMSGFTVRSLISVKMQLLSLESLSGIGLGYDTVLAVDVCACVVAAHSSSDELITLLGYVESLNAKIAQIDSWALQYEGLQYSLANLKLVSVVPLFSEAEQSSLQSIKGTHTAYQGYRSEYVKLLDSIKSNSSYSDLLLALSYYEQYTENKRAISYIAKNEDLIRKLGKQRELAAVVAANNRY